MTKQGLWMISLAVLLAGCGISKDKYSSLESQANRCQAELTSVNEAKNSCQKNLNSLTSTKSELEEKTRTYEDLVGKLQGEIKDGKIQISEMENRLTVKMIDKILFSSGSTKVAEEGKEALAKVAGVLKDVKGKRIQVEGHTDNVGLGPSLQARFPTNWELSTARATAVVHELSRNGVAESILSASGYGMHKPVASNEEETGRSQNRRIEIVLVPE